MNAQQTALLLRHQLGLFPSPRENYVERLYLGQDIPVARTHGQTMEDKLRKIIPPGWFDPQLFSLRSNPAPARSAIFEKITRESALSDFLGKTALELNLLRWEFEQAISVLVDHPDKFPGNECCTFCLLTHDCKPVMEDFCNVLVLAIRVCKDGEPKLTKFNLLSEESERTWNPECGHQVLRPGLAINGSFYRW